MQSGGSVSSDVAAFREFAPLLVYSCRVVLIRPVDGMMKIVGETSEKVEFANACPVEFWKCEISKMSVVVQEKCDFFARSFSLGSGVTPPVPSP